MNINDVEVGNIVQAYRGKPGCMCGCLGNYFYNPRHIDMLGDALGYKICKDEKDIDEKALKRVLNKMKKNASIVEMHSTYAFAEIGTRYYAVYFTAWCSK